MAYRLRHIQDRVQFLSSHFKIILITGARQVGKTTLLRKLFTGIPMVTFDRLTDEYGVKDNPDLFLRTQPTPLLLDEVQYVPELLSAIKRKVDESDRMGQYFLTGSHNLNLLKEAAESMAGRVGIIDLDHVTCFEEGEAFTFSDVGQTPPSWLTCYLEQPDALPQRFAGLLTQRTPLHAVWRGGFPGLLDRPDDLVPNYFESYLRTYVERDALFADPTAAQPGFHRFLKLMAAVTAQEVNYLQFSRELEVARSVVKRWQAVLERTYQWFEVPSYATNMIKRVTKRSKGYFADSGFACYLMGMRSHVTLLSHDRLGPLFETYCMSMIRALLGGMRRRPEVYHWRAASGAEVDIVIAIDGKLYPIEVKVRSHITKHDARGILAFRETYGAAVQHGIILYTGMVCRGVNEHVTALPFNAVMRPEL